MLESLCMKLLPVSDDSSQRPTMDVVERLLEDPWTFDIINIELAIWWHPLRLYRRYVGSMHDRSGKFISHLYRPNARACTNVEHALRLFQRRRV